jgi:Uncharacterised nucleotidyltransferase
MTAAQGLLVRALRTPGEIDRWLLADWDLLIRQARSADLLPRLAWLSRQSGVWDRLPDKVRSHLEAATVIAARQDQALRWELTCIAKALKSLPGPTILLKGAAYFAAGLPPAAGRLFSDIDLLVKKEQLPEAEADLMLNGWHAAQHSAYDQRYYRKWMHEIPPLQHVKRLSVIDLHHAILPVTARIKSDPSPLFSAARPLPDYPAFHVLGDADMVLHSATHLFSEGDFHHGLRDLVDLDALFRHFGPGFWREGFWRELEVREKLLGLSRPLYYAVRYCRAIMGTPVPEDVGKSGRPAFPDTMDALFGRALAPDHPSCGDAFTGLARRLLYVRGHWLRMPMHLLVPHLFYKAFLARED